jgi:zinc and cadmium transporter
MITYILGLIVSLAAGSLFIFNPPKNNKWIYLLLSAGGAYLIAIIFTHILPELFEVLPEKAGLVLLIGFLLQILLENYSKGIEHGHAHGSHNNQGLIISFVALCIHALVEGMPLASLISGNGIGFNQQLATGIMLHKVPVAITLATMPNNKKKTKRKQKKKNKQTSPI